MISQKLTQNYTIIIDMIRSEKMGSCNNPTNKTIIVL